MAESVKHDGDGSSNLLERQAAKAFDVSALSAGSTPFTTLPNTLLAMQLERGALVSLSCRLGSEHDLDPPEKERLYFLLDACQLVEQAGLVPEQLQGLSPTQVKFLCTFWTEMVDLPHWDAIRTDHDLVEEIATFRMQELRCMDPKGKALMHQREEQGVAYFRVLKRLGEYSKNPRIRAICMQWMKLKDTNEE